jgi:hypothetical protein
MTEEASAPVEAEEELFLTVRKDRAVLKDFVIPESCRNVHVYNHPAVQKLIKTRYKPPTLGGRVCDHVVFVARGVHKPATNEEKDYDRLFILDLTKTTGAGKIDHYCSPDKGMKIAGFILNRQQRKRDSVYVEDAFGRDVRDEVYNAIIRNMVYSSNEHKAQKVATLDVENRELKARIEAYEAEQAANEEADKLSKQPSESKESGTTSKSEEKPKRNSDKGSKRLTDGNAGGKAGH